MDVSRTTTARVLARTVGVWADLLAESASVAEAAHAIGVQESRVRQRLGDRTLYGFKHDGVWYIPRFQFYRDQLLPGLAVVVSHLPKTLAPLAVVSWFVTPSVDLALNDHATSPRDWLIAGGNPTVVAVLASDL